MTNPFVTGGSVPADSPVYVERDADARVRQHLVRMEYILLIEPRQQGKTSLLQRLPGAMGPQYAFSYINAPTLDKSGEAQWYASLCHRLLPDLDFLTPGEPPPLVQNSASWYNLIVYLARQAEQARRRLVIVFDEVGDMDVPWRTGFFSTIRAVFDERSHRTYLRHLTFILAGAYSPRQLIRDARTSPFNIAQQVDLPDFTFDQTQQLVAFLGQTPEVTTVLVQSIYDWTSGQPYLTQRICRSLAQYPIPLTPDNVERIVHDLYHHDRNHLPPILEALEKNRRLLDYAHRVMEGHRPHFRPATDSVHHGPLGLIGLLKADAQGLTMIRNRLYEMAVQDLLASLSPAPQAPQPSAVLYVLQDQFSLQELSTICFEIGVPYDELEGQALTPKARELIKYIQRHEKRLDRLVEAIRRARPGSL